MSELKNKKILLIITGGIAAYKSLELIRLLKKKRSLVKTILSKNAHKFVTPLSVTSLSQEKVYSDLFDPTSEAEMDHISLSRWADIILIAPATANTLSKISNANADDLASTVLLAADKEFFIAPAMNVRMWENYSNKKNVSVLKNMGHEFIGPDIGDMACGEYGEGKMTEPPEIVKHLEAKFKELKKNNGLKALVTAGPTKEFIDPVRYITNKSSGKQGYEIANSLRRNGFNTTLISGPTQLNPIKGVNTINVNSAKEMFDAVIENLPVDVAIFSAAVADFKAKDISETKIKNKDNYNLTLEKNIDILKHVSNHNSLRPKLVLGFSAETNDIIENSQKKINEKNCDLLIANDVSNQEIGFDSDFNEVSILHKNGEIEKISKDKKSVIANKIVKKIVSNLD
ncbi:bifunctional phosphopantothenoylcysteine decarboxylase/phosphopantothenate--cysteine ligase CoaBC [Candidatus Pelagibacter sp.]|nr:bifunctional phosphopantothenoylcysteine decarboxylase/phosphopantothenate--cysteine ligase CoaBC [Candidatus Pelagibacter sp.]